MKEKKDIVAAIKKQGVLPLYFNADERVSIEILRALYRAGIRAIEYTNRGAAAFSNFKALLAVRNTEMTDLYLGIGTLKKIEEAKEYAAAGADFFISPGYVPEIAVFAKEHNLLYAPGCMTPTEIIEAENNGVTFIKLFPGNVLGPGFMNSIGSVFPNLDFMPTGGVEPTHESVKAWFNAGVCAVGMGSNLVTKDFLQNNDYKGIEAKTAEVLQLIKEFINP
ncbi:ketohydroxyglutarate aldolase [Flavobacterium akiainvivens]|uniref:Ketohydroxyglutarate aldolase n=1 Tax=Flavobacterium akiainvivens TaxID=1202724 RepID=A0A0M8MH33_9FLAO|nr:ketohydroxyglutarate aldolase [Flavobacterium akiainvivens]KOS05647.1 ketohydroxyglutarate aldolase [Flavobacterium akiainvivens]SFQ35973.1 2-dehydro-3-deoxyphosphogluconate aldolase / (4S)-4-hydroxy-2-oxoglutarate aldolase [Flavobacterium akiainvivens]